MTRTFKLKIELENDAMRTGTNVARALREIASSLIAEEGSTVLTVRTEGSIRDINGNTVGHYEVNESR